MLILPTLRLCGAIFLAIACLLTHGYAQTPPGSKVTGDIEYRSGEPWYVIVNNNDQPVLVNFEVTFLDESTGSRERKRWGWLVLEAKRGRAEELYNRDASDWRINILQVLWDKALPPPPPPAPPAPPAPDAPKNPAPHPPTRTLHSDHSWAMFFRDVSKDTDETKTLGAIEKYLGTLQAFIDVVAVDGDRTEVQVWLSNSQYWGFRPNEIAHVDQATKQKELWHGRPFGPTGQGLPAISGTWAGQPSGWAELLVPQATEGASTSDRLNGILKAIQRLSVAVDFAGSQDDGFAEVAIAVSHSEKWILCPTVVWGYDSVKHAKPMTHIAPFGVGAHPHYDRGEGFLNRRSWLQLGMATDTKDRIRAIEVSLRRLAQNLRVAGDRDTGQDVQIWVTPNRYWSLRPTKWTFVADGKDVHHATLGGPFVR